jgi:hypothetical protein
VSCRPLLTGPSLAAIVAIPDVERLRLGVGIPPVSAIGCTSSRRRTLKTARLREVEPRCGIHRASWDALIKVVVWRMSVAAAGCRRGIEIVISVPGEVARTSIWPPQARTLARMDARPM